MFINFMFSFISLSDIVWFSGTRLAELCGLLLPTFCLLLVATFHLVLEVFARQLLLSAKLSQHSAVI